MVQRLNPKESCLMGNHAAKVLSRRQDRVQRTSPYQGVADHAVGEVRDTIAYRAIRYQLIEITPNV